MTKPPIHPIPFAARSVTNKTIVAKFSCIMLAFYIAASIPTSAQTFTKLVNFSATAGNSPDAPLVQGLDGNFYGTAVSGGANDLGTVFRTTPEGRVALLHTFAFSDGESPSSLILATGGDFYGVTATGGARSNCVTDYCGTIFRISSSGALTTFYEFCAQANCADGSIPSSIMQAADGNFYGTTASGGTNYSDFSCGSGGCGTFFKITPDGNLVTLYNFCSLPDCADGSEPRGIVQAADGNFYGTTIFGGANITCGSGYECGTVFKITSEGKLSTLYNFCPQAGCADGYFAIGGIIQGTDGNFYGANYGGGRFYKGTIFKLTRTGTLTTLHTFKNRDGESPVGRPIQASDGNLYGTTEFGGTESINCQDVGCGTVFEITRGGALSTLYRLHPVDGSYPSAPLAQGTDGNFYGTTSGNGATGYGTVFRVSTGISPFIKTLPTVGKAGTRVHILGNNLTGAMSVTFNGTPATFAVVSDTQITATVPTGAITGQVEVTTPGATLKSNVVFHVLQ
jgi:uncharacterized repeat protein (TIGR03803 family)